MSVLTPPLVESFSRAYAAGVSAHLTREYGESVFVYYSAHEQLFHHAVDDEGMAGDDMGLVVGESWREIAPVTSGKLGGWSEGAPPEWLARAIADEILSNGFAAKGAEHAYLHANAEI